MINGTRYKIYVERTDDVIEEFIAVDFDDTERTFSIHHEKPLDGKQRFTVFTWKMINSIEILILDDEGGDANAD